MPRKSAPEETLRTGYLNSIFTKHSRFPEISLDDSIDFISSNIVIEKGEGILIWSPLDNTLILNQKLEKVENISYKHIIPFFIQSNLINNNFRTTVSLCNLFISAYTFCRANIDKAINILFKNSTYLDDFTFSIGKSLSY